MARDGTLFVVAGGTQWRDALLIAAEVDGPAWVLDLGTMTLREPPPSGTPYDGDHWPRQGPVDLVRLLRVLRAQWPRTAVVVLGQDAGRLQRVVVASARRYGVRVAVVPDGALFEGAAALGRRAQWEEQALRVTGLAAGRPLQFGATAPDLWCAWGDGWRSMLEGFSPTGVVEVTGSPRGAALLGLPPRTGTVQRLLVCSQPTWVHPFPASPTVGAAWYGWLERMASSAPAGSLVVRLHPRERDIAHELGLGPATSDALSDRRELVDDLRDVDGMVAPFSTVLVEAAAAGRRVVSVVPEPACVAVRYMSPAMRDPALRVVVADECGDYESLARVLERDGEISAWGRRFARLDPDAPAWCADALQRLTRLTRPTGSTGSTAPLT